MKSPSCVMASPELLGFACSQMMKVNITKFNKRFGICKAHGESFVGTEMACDCDITLVIAKQSSSKD